MTFKLLWSEESLDDLTRLWTQADSASRKALTAATHRLEKQLTRDPENTGETRGGEQKVCFEFPLALFFELDLSRKEVHVLQAWRYRKRT